MKKTFGFNQVDAYYHQYFIDGAWQAPTFTRQPNIEISMSSTSLHYGQQAFEGMKAYHTKDGRILLFRPLENAKRFRQSCRFMMMPEISNEHFLNAIFQTVNKNLNHMPPYDYHQALYIRPFMIGVGHNVGLKPANEYYFGVLVTPVGEYLESDAAYPYVITEQDRVAPNGSGPYKVGGNYGSVLKIQHEARMKGFQDVIFLDPLTHTKLDEGAGSNIFGIKENTYVTPSSKTILKSITNDALKIIAKDLGYKVLEKDIYIEDLEGFEEMGACGTAAIVSPIGSITYQDHTYTFGHQMGMITKQLRQRLLEIQYGDYQDIHHWMVEITL